MKLKKSIEKGNRLSGKNTDWERYKEGIKLRYEELKEIGKDNVLMVYDKLCEIMKEEVCSATGKRYKNSKTEEKCYNIDINKKEANNKKKEGRKRQQIEWWDKDCEDADEEKKIKEVYEK